MNEVNVGTRIIRQLIITAGFLPGLWFYIGVDPEAVVAYAVIDVIAEYMSQLAIGSKVGVSTFGSLVYNFAGFIGTIFTVIFVYFTGGGWAILLLALAFAGGCTINVTISISNITIHALGIWLFITAWIIAPFIRENEEWAL